MHILDGFRTRQSEEHTRYNNLLSHQRGHALVIRKKWRQLKQFLIGPRGSWAQRCVFPLFLFNRMYLNFLFGVEPILNLGGSCRLVKTVHECA